MIFNNIDLREYLNFTNIKTSLLPQISNTSKKIPGKNGEVFVKTELGIRAITSDVEVKGISKGDLSRVLTNLSNVLYTAEPKKLKVHDYDEKYYLAILDGSTDLEEILYYGITELTFIAHDPIAYGATLTKTVSADTVVMNYGTYDTKGVFTIVLTADTSLLEVTSITTGKHVSIEHEFIAGDIVEVDCITEKITKNGYLIKDDLTFNSDYFDILKGKNVINISGDEQATLTFTERWLY